MRKVILANKNVLFEFFFFVILSIERCESYRNIDGDYPTQQHRPRDLDHYINQHQEGNPHPSSDSPSIPRRIGLNMNGRVKSLLWSNPQSFIESALTPLFSSSCEYEDEEDGHQINSNSPATKANSGADKNLRGLISSILPGDVYGTADYRFRKERWYGVEKIGMIFRWHMPRSWSQCNSKEDGDGSKDFFPTKVKSALSPMKVDISVHCSIFPPSKVNRNEAFTSFADSGNVRIGWQQNDDGDIIGVGGTNPWIQIGYDPKHFTSDDFFEMTRTEQTKNPFHLRFFLPLIRHRFDLQWTSRWNNLSTNLTSEKNANKESDTESQWCPKYRRSNEDPWFIPQVSLDPSMGTLSSKNRYRNTFLGKDNRQYLTEFKLRIRTTMPTLLSSFTNNAVAASDDDDLQTASLRLEYSLMTDPVERRCSSLGQTCTTARFETVIIPFFWLRSVKETARFGLIHEKKHVINC